MTPKIIASLVAIATVAAVAGGATVAYFSDTETSTGNTFSSANFDLALSNGGDYKNVWSGELASFSNVAPGETKSPITLGLKNAGSIDGLATVQLTIAENDAVEPAGAEFAGQDLDEYAFAKLVIVPTATLDGGSTNVAPWWAKQIIDEKYAGVGANAVAASAVVVDSNPATGYLPTMFGLPLIKLDYRATYSGTNVAMASGSTHVTAMDLKLSEVAGNDAQFDGIYVTVNASLEQVH